MFLLWMSQDVLELFAATKALFPHESDENIRL
jgi:hypothetical protein